MKYIVNKWAVTERYKAFFPIAEYLFHSKIYGVFSCIEHILSHTRSLTKFKTEIISDNIADHNGETLEINTMRNLRKI